MKKKIIIIGSNPDFLKELNTFFSSTNNYEVSGSTADGITGLKLIRELKPDVLILELSMPYSNGFSVLKNLTCKQNLKIIAVSPLNDEILISKAINLGADYCMLKPLSYSNLKIFIDEILAPKTAASIPSAQYGKNHIEEKITNIFISLGIPAHINGFYFLREAVKLAMGNYKTVCSITKELYPKVAAHFETEPYNVERGIRHAIDVAWSKGKITNINNLFGLRIYDVHEKPTNSELIALLADKMFLEST